MAVVIVPGLFRKKDFYKPLAKAFREKGFKVIIADLGYNLKNLKTSSEAMKKYLKKTKEKDDIIAHSYGGIIIKYLLLNNPHLLDQFKSIIFVSVPHGGSWKALFLSMVPSAREVLPFRTHLKRLSSVPLPENTVNFISERELKIWPRKHGLLKGYIDIVIPDTNHDSIVNNSNFISKAIEFIKI